MKVHLLQSGTEGCPTQVLLATVNIPEGALVPFLEGVAEVDLDVDGKIYKVKKSGKFPSGTPWLAVQQVSGPGGSMDGKNAPRT